MPPLNGGSEAEERKGSYRNKYQNRRRANKSEKKKAKVADPERWWKSEARGIKHVLVQTRASVWLFANILAVGRLLHGKVFDAL
jgi:hypothetical protein